MANIPTKEQIEEEIKKLTKMKPNVKRTSIFGDNHHDAIDAQIDVLKNRWTEDNVYDNYPSQEDLEAIADHGEEIDDTAYPSNVSDGALEASQWMFYGGDKPSDGWKELIKK